MLRPSPARLLLVVAVIALCGMGLITQAQQHMILYRTPFAQPLEWGPAGEPLTERVVVCLVDGLRVDTSYGMEELNGLRKRGADWLLSVTEPTFSILLSHVIITGAPQTTIGMLHNRAPIGSGFYEVFGNIYTAAQRVGLRTGNVVTWRPGYPLESILDAPNTLPGRPDDRDDDGLVPRVREVLATPDAPQLLWVHFDIVDRAGHVAGAAREDYTIAAKRTDERIGEIARLLDLSRDTLIVTADHGHLDGGGHGGGERIVATVPCVLVGAGVRPGTQGEGEQIDLASTIAWLLGTPIPTHNQGWPLAEALDVSEEFLGRRGRDTAAQRLAAYRFRTERLGIHDEKLDAPLPFGLRTDLADQALANGAWNVAWSESANLATELQTRWRALLSQQRERVLRPRIYSALGLGLLAFATSVFLRRRSGGSGAAPIPNPPLWLLVGIALAVALPVALYLGTGHGLSLSWPGRSGIAAFAPGRILEGAAGLIVAWLVAVSLARRDQNRPQQTGAILSGIAGGVAGAFLVGCVVYLLGRGIEPKPWDTGFRPMAMLLVAAFQMLGVGLVALVGAVIVAWRTRDAWPEDAAPADTNPPGQTAG